MTNLLRLASKAPKPRCLPSRQSTGTMRKLLLRAAAVHPLRFSGKTMSISEEWALKFSSAFMDRCYATFDFVVDSSSESMESKPSSVPVDRIRSEKTSRKNGKKKKKPQPESALRQQGASLENFNSKTASTEQSVLLPRSVDPITPNWMCSVSKSPSKDEDNFAELGMPVITDGDAGPKLVNKTHKTSLNMETYAHPLLRFLSKPEDHHGNSMVKNDAETQKCRLKKGPSCKIQNLVIVEDIPLGLTLSELKKSASAYGNILSASMRVAQDGFKSCVIEFESVESMERTLAAQHVTVRHFHLPVRSLETPKVVIVRISNVSLETTEPSIHSVCMRYGSVAGLLRTKDGAVEVLFSISESLDAENIVKKLNNVSIDDCKWSAQLLSKNISNTTTDVDDAKCSVESQIMCLIEDLKKEIGMKKIYLEDLVELHQAVVHMRDCPSASDL